MKARKFVAVVLLLIAATVMGQEATPVGLLVATEGGLPIGSRDKYYDPGAGGLLSADFGVANLGSRARLAALAELGYSFVPLASQSNLSLIRGTAGVQATLLLGDRFSLFGFGEGGGYYGMLRGSRSYEGHGIVTRLGCGAAFSIGRSLSLSAGAAYTGYIDLYDGVQVFLGTRFSLGRPTGSRERTQTAPDRGRPETLPADRPVIGETEGGVRIEEIELTRVFPVLFKYYDTNPIGSAVLVNGTEDVLKDVEVEVHVERYMDKPKVCASFDQLDPGQWQEIDLYALFNDQVLSITEGTKVAAEVTLAYRAGVTERETSETLTLETYDRNALRWDDDRKVAAFVTAKDEEIQRLAKNMAALSRRTAVEAVSSSLQLAMVEFAAMQELHLAYVVDPSSAYSELSRNEAGVDYVQFPRQTLQFQAGDCDDLSSTYAALLEAVGVSTAFITIPGHIFAAFSLDLSAEEARRTIANSEDLIVREDGTVWVPVETTLVDRSFSDAWATGARQWREHSRTGSAGFFPTAEAWSIYEPVAFSVSDIELRTPDAQAVSALFERELDRYVNRQIHDQEEELLHSLAARPDDSRTRNRLGVLYARYGKMEEARTQFQRVLSSEQYAPALLNLGNIAFLEEEYRQARRFYERAVEADPYNSTALLGLARVAHLLEEYNEAERHFDVLARLDQGLAERFSYLDPSRGASEGRAGSSAQFDRVVVWGEVEG